MLWFVLSIVGLETCWKRNYESVLSFFYNYYEKNINPMYISTSPVLTRAQEYNFSAWKRILIKEHKSSN